MVIRSGRAKTGGKKYAVADGVSEEDKEIIKGALQWNLAGTDKGPSTWRSDWRDATKEYRAFMATKKGKALDNAQLIKTDEFIAMKKAYDLFLENNPDGPKIQQPKRRWSQQEIKAHRDGLRFGRRQGQKVVAAHQPGEYARVVVEDVHERTQELQK